MESKTQGEKRCACGAALSGRQVKYCTMCAERRKAEMHAANVLKNAKEKRKQAERENPDALSLYVREVEAWNARRKKQGREPLSYGRYAQGER